MGPLWGKISGLTTQKPHRRPLGRSALQTIGGVASPSLWVPSGEILLPSHSEYPEGGRGDVGVQRGGQAQGQHGAGVDRVDDAIVPQARGRVVRVALGL